MKKLTTLALAALLTTVTATSVFAASSATQDTTVGYTVGGLTPGGSHYKVVIPKDVVLKDSKTASKLNVKLEPTTGTTLPDNIDIGVTVSSANTYNLKRTTDDTASQIKWTYMFKAQDTDTLGEGGTSAETASGNLGSLTKTNIYIAGTAKIDADPTVSFPEGTKFTDTLTYTLTENNNGTNA